MKGLREKFRKNEGFTMVELLIVVAIIGILAAVSIPMFNNALEKARHGVDAANARNAISLANAEAIASLKPEKEFAGNGKVYYYIVDESENTDHQAALVDTLGSNTGVKPKCTKITETNPLMVKIEYNAANASTNPLSVFTITSSWEFDDNGHVKTAKTEDAFKGTGTGGSGG